MRKFIRRGYKETEMHIQQKKSLNNHTAPDLAAAAADAVTNCSQVPRVSLAGSLRTVRLPSLSLSLSPSLPHSLHKMTQGAIPCPSGCSGQTFSLHPI